MGCGGKKCEFPVGGADGARAIGTSVELPAASPTAKARPGPLGEYSSARVGQAERAAERERGLFELAWPLVLSFWLRAAFTWVDRIYASKLDGLEDASQAAIGLAQPFEFLLIALWVGTSNGLTAKLAAAIGGGQGELVEQWKRASRRIVAFLIALFVLVAAAIWFGAHHVGLDPVIARQFQLYATVLVGGCAFTMFWSILPDSIVKAHQDTRTTMWSGLVSSILNVILNTTFLFVFGWGIVGLALATVLARLGGFVYAKTMADRHERRRQARDDQDRPGRETRPVRALLGIAIPSGLTYVLMSLEGFALNGMLAHSDEAAVAIPAWSIWDATLRLMAMPAIALGVAALPLAARRRARGDWAGLARELRLGLFAILAYALFLVWPTIWYFGDRVAGALLASPEAAAATVRGYQILPLVLLGLMPVFLLRPVFDAVGLSRTGLALSTVRSVLFIVPSAAIGGMLSVEMGHARIDGLYVGLGAGALMGSLLVGLSLVRALALARAQAQRRDTLLGG